MAAEFEEVIVAPYLLDLQQIAPDIGQGHFQLALRRLVFTPWHGVAIRHRQGTSIDLAVGGQWPGIEAHERTRHHVARQTVQQVGT